MVGFLSLYSLFGFFFFQFLTIWESCRRFGFQRTCIIISGRSLHLAICDIRVRQHLGSNIPLEPLEATWLKSGRSYWPNIHLITSHYVAENSIQRWIIYQLEPRQLYLFPSSYLHSYSISGPFVNNSKPQKITFSCEWVLCPTSP